MGQPLFGPGPPCRCTRPRRPAPPRRATMLLRYSPPGSVHGDHSGGASGYGRIFAWSARSMSLVGPLGLDVVLRLHDPAPVPVLPPRHDAVWPSPNSISHGSETDRCVSVMPGESAGTARSRAGLKRAYMCGTAVTGRERQRS